MDKFRKQPNEVLDYSVIATDWLPASDTISGVEVLIGVYSGSETSPTLIAGSTSVSADTVVIWLSGGTEQVDYKVTARITTTGGRVKEHEFRIQVREV